MTESRFAAIDIGNTRTKIGIFSHDQMVESFQGVDSELIITRLNHHQVSRVIVSSVNKMEDQDELVSKLHEFQPLHFNQKTSLPIKIQYDSLQTLGVDRIAAAVAASQLYPEKNTLSIDCGSCITYDFLKAGKYYLGGAISPGIAMKLKALHNFTARLPLVESVKTAPLIGKTTEQSILSGVINGALAEIEGMIGQYKSAYPDLIVVLCGGDALFFDGKIKGANFVVEDLVLIGLNQVLLYNV